MSTHSERLADDLAKVRILIEENADGDDQLRTDLSEIATMMVANLNRCRASEADFYSLDCVNDSREWIARFFLRMTGIDLGDCRIKHERSREARVLDAQLADLRRMFSAAIYAEEPRPKDLGRLVRFIIRNEISLQTECVRSGEYVTKAQGKSLVVEWSDSHYQRPDFLAMRNADPKEWARKVDEALASRLNP
jgi:hypothetical protein